MTYYLRNKKTGKDCIITFIDFTNEKVTAYDDDSDMELTLVDWANDYELRYDFW